jgi:hypothetical protein
MRRQRSKPWQSPVLHAFWRSVGGKSPQRAVERVCDSHLMKLGKSAPPFQTPGKYEYATLLGLDVIERKLTCDGSLSRIGDRFYVQVNENSAPTRKNFTVCHELCHYDLFLRCDRRLMLQPHYSREEEDLCDFYASNMLMPRKPFRKIASPLSPGVESIARLSELFMTSYEATARRIVDLKIWKIALAFWKPSELCNGRLGLELLSWMPSPCPFGKDRYLQIRRHLAVNDAPETAIHDTLKQGQTRCSIVLPDRSLRHRVLSAESIRLSGGRVLTVFLNGLLTDTSPGTTCQQ